MARGADGPREDSRNASPEGPFRRRTFALLAGASERGDQTLEVPGSQSSAESVVLATSRSATRFAPAWAMTRSPQTLLVRNRARDRASFFFETSRFSCAFLIELKALRGAARIAPREVFSIIEY